MIPCYDEAPHRHHMVFMALALVNKHIDEVKCPALSILDDKSGTGMCRDGSTNPLAWLPLFDNLPVASQSTHSLLSTTNIFSRLFIL